MSDAPQTPTAKDVSTMKRERFLYLVLGTVLAAIVVYFVLSADRFFSSTIENENVKLRGACQHQEKPHRTEDRRTLPAGSKQAKKSVLKDFEGQGQ